MAPPPPPAAQPAVALSPHARPCLPTTRPPAAPGSGPNRSPRLYRPRNPFASPLYRLLCSRFEDFKHAYEELYACDYGPWRGTVDTVVRKFLACGDLRCGMARLHCRECKNDYFIGFSCKSHRFCPSCHANCHAKGLASYCPPYV